MNRNVSLVLENILVNKLDKYLRLEANELIFNKPCEINIDYGTHWEIIEDEELSYNVLNDFLVELATRRNQRYDEKHCHLSCELPRAIFALSCPSAAQKLFI